MIVHHTLQTWFKARSEILSRQRDTRAIGFVPTMGALHQGHISLLQRCKRENDVTLLSLFVNPTQFDNQNDFVNYPITIKDDLEKAEAVGCDHVILPDSQSMYPDSYKFRVSEIEFSKIMEGAHRAGHFDGVLTVVLKLLNLAQCGRAYFGEKDFQQLELIRRMTEALFLNVEIVPCSTVREHDGLAMSSRNIRLTPEHRLLAPLFFKALANAPSATTAREQLEKAGIEVDYVEDHNDRRFGAIRLGDVRLIDNIQLRLHSQNEKVL